MTLFAVFHRDTDAQPWQFIGIYKGASAADAVGALVAPRTGEVVVCDLAGGTTFKVTPVVPRVTANAKISLLP